MSWSAAQYSKFENERNRPIRDLVAQIPNTSVSRVADLGCGPGNSTEFLMQRFPQAAAVGVDNSSDMLEAAGKRLPGASFEQDDIAKWSNSGPFDVILSNAALQWVPDHASLLPALIGKLGSGGSLAVQIPDNLLEPAHVLMREVAGAGPWSEKLVNAARSLDSRHSAEWYYRVLHDLGATVNVWRTVYHHRLEGGAAAIVQWFEGTALRPFLDPLDASQRTEFRTRYEDALREPYPALADGSVLLPFPRLFFVATL